LVAYSPPGRSYFGLERLSDGGLDRLSGPVDTPDEAHLVYQFPLPPLLLHTLTSGEAGTLATWLSSLPELPPGCSYLNFTASHDGIGVRPLEGRMPAHDIEALTELMHRFGGFVSMRANPGGEDTPYEINITWFDAMKGTRRGADPWQVERFLCSQNLMMALQGIPALYLHSMTASLNDHEGVERSGRLRSLNRRRWQREELDELLDSRNTPTREVFMALKRRLAVRRREPARCCHRRECPPWTRGASASPPPRSDAHAAQAPRPPATSPRPARHPRPRCCAGS
jgi:sucrose phosphorylase